MSNISLIELVKASQYLLSKIAKHPDFLALKYHPDLSIGNAETALSNLKDALLKSCTWKYECQNHNYVQGEQAVQY